MPRRSIKLLTPLGTLKRHIKLSDHISRQGAALRSLAVDKFATVVGSFGVMSGGKHKLYGVLRGMIQRCTDPKTHGFHRYGGRGIKVCGEWMLNADKFASWALDSGWKDGLQIDRIDNDKGYYPENCRFVTPLENQRNK